MSPGLYIVDQKVTSDFCVTAGISFLLLSSSHALNIYKHLSSSDCLSPTHVSRRFELRSVDEICFKEKTKESETKSSLIASDYHVIV